MLRKVTHIRRGKRIYHRIPGTNRFQLVMEHPSITCAKRFCSAMPEGTVVRYEWVVKRLAGKRLPELCEKGVIVNG